jgi:hypothetical protein
MRRIVGLALLLAFSLPCAAADDPVIYVGGTVPGLQQETNGLFDTSDKTSLIFQHAAGKVAIPFSTIVSYQYTEKVTHHLGALPAIAVGLLRARKRQHVVRITYRDESNAPQVALFQVPKQMPQTLMPILEARAPPGCTVNGNPPCPRHP